MTIQHTPGPWAYEPSSGAIYFADGDVQPLIASTNLECVSIEQGDADGRLIAAAPAMLAALRNVIPLALEAPAARATSDDDDDRELFADYQRDVDQARALVASLTPTADAPAPAPTAQPAEPYRSQWVSAIIRKSWEPRLSVFATEEQLRADLLEYARETLEIEGLTDDATLADLADAIGGYGEQTYWEEC